MSCWCEGCGVSVCARNPVESEQVSHWQEWKQLNEPHLFRKFLCAQKVWPFLFVFFSFCLSCIIIKCVFVRTIFFFLANQYSVFEPSLPQRVQVVSDVAVGGFSFFPSPFQPSLSLWVLKCGAEGLAVIKCQPWKPIVR